MELQPNLPNFPQLPKSSKKSSGGEEVESPIKGIKSVAEKYQNLRYVVEDTIQADYLKLMETLAGTGFEFWDTHKFHFIPRLPEDHIVSKDRNTVRGMAPDGSMFPGTNGVLGQELSAVGDRNMSKVIKWYKPTPGKGAHPTKRPRPSLPWDEFRKHFSPVNTEMFLEFKSMRENREFRPSEYSSALKYPFVIMELHQTERTCMLTHLHNGVRARVLRIFRSLEALGVGHVPYSVQMSKYFDLHEDGAAREWSRWLRAGGLGCFQGTVILPPDAGAVVSIQNDENFVLESQLWPETLEYAVGPRQNCQEGREITDRPEMEDLLQEAKWEAEAMGIPRRIEAAERWSHYWERHGDWENRLRICRKPIVVPSSSPGSVFPGKKGKKRRMPEQAASAEAAAAAVEDL